MWQFYLLWWLMSIFNILAIISSKRVHPSGVHCEYCMWRRFSLPAYCHLFYCPQFRAEGAGIQLGAVYVWKSRKPPRWSEIQVFSSSGNGALRPLARCWETLFYDSSWADHRRRHPAKETRKGKHTIAHLPWLCPMTAERVKMLFVPVFQAEDIYSFPSKESSAVDSPIVVIVESQHN